MFKTKAIREGTLEPGILTAFRVFNLLPTLRLLSFPLITLIPNKPHLLPEITSGIFISILFILELGKLLFLFWPHLPQKLGDAFLTIGLILGMLPPLSAVFYVLAVNPAWIYSQLSGESLLFYFLIPLIFIAWQYTFRGILVYSGFLALIEFALHMKLLEFQPNLWLLFQGPMIRLASYLVIGYFITYLVAAQRKQRNELAKANTQLLQYSHTLEQLAESRERNRLARELHDTLAHYMSGTILQLNGVKTVWEKDDTKAKAMLSEAVQTLSEGLEETRNAIQTLRKSSVENLGLSESLQDLATQYAEKLGLELRLELESIRYLPNAVGQALYHIAQEILRNVERHAYAKTLVVILKRQAKHLLLVIEDDGKGFELEKIDRTRHFGLLGLEERTTLLNGDVSIHSRPNQGTRIEIRIPVSTS